MYFCGLKNGIEAMECFQFAALVVLTLLTLTLVLLPRRVAVADVPFRSRWLIAGGTGILALHFLLQLLLGLRSKGVTEAILLNLFMFVPAAWLLSLGVLYIQRRGEVRRRDWLVGPICWGIVTLLLAVAYFLSDEPVLSEMHKLHIAELMASVVYFSMQCHFTFFQFRELRRMHRALDNYYDRDMSELLLSMERAMEVLATFAVMVPVVIYDSGWFLMVFGILFLCGIFFFVMSYFYYVVGSNWRQVMEAEQHDDEVNAEDQEEPDEKPHAPEMNQEDRLRIESAVNRWISKGGHLKSGITIQAAADEMKIPRYQLSAWLKTTDQELFSPWLTHLRIDEAKRIMTEHPDWSNDIIAEHCGFGSRSYFQTVFHKQTGMTPVKFLEESSSLK